MNEYFMTRLKNAGKKIEQAGIDAFLVSSRENYIYLSGFTGTSANLLITSDRAYLLTDFRYTRQAGIQSPHFEIVETKDMNMTLGSLIKANNIKRLGFEASEMTYKRYSAMKEKFSETMLVPCDDLIEGLRVIKDEMELDLIKKAVEIADNAFTHILGFIKPGISEKDVAFELEYFVRKNGGTKMSFETIVASGVRSCMPHGVASDKIIMENDVVTLDFGAVYNGYCSDMTRTIFVKNASDEMLKIYDIVLKAQKKAASGAFKGMTGIQIDNIAREIISSAGYADNFGHGLGHGVGLNIHEEPRLSLTGNTVMENNMVVSIEPGIYINDFGGVRIEDLIIIKDNDPVILTRSTKDVVIV